MAISAGRLVTTTRLHLLVMPGPSRLCRIAGVRFGDLVPLLAAFGWLVTFGRTVCLPPLRRVSGARLRGELGKNKVGGGMHHSRQSQPQPRGLS